MASPTAPAQQAPAPVSSVGRIFGVFFEPKATFESIAQKPTWVLPLLIVIVLSLASVAVIGSRVGWRQVIDHQIASSPRTQQQLEQVPPAQREARLATQAKYAGVIGYVGAVVGTIIVEVIVAAVLLALFNIISGSKLGFSTSLGIVAHSWMPYVIAGILGIVVLFIKDPTTVDIQNLVASNPGALLPDTAPRWLVALLTSFDIFTFWVLILQAIGFRATNPKKITFAKAFGSILVIWLLFVLVKVGLAAAFS